MMVIGIKITEVITMNLRDVVFEPHSDMSADDVELVNQHDNLIKQNRYDDATALLNNSKYKKGFRASLFNSIQNKIRALEIYLLNEYVAETDELYSFTEPTEEQMKDKTFWIKIY